MTGPSGVTYNKMYTQSPFLTKLEERLKYVQKEREDHVEKNVLKRLKSDIQMLWDSKSARPPFKEEVYCNIVQKYINDDIAMIRLLIEAGGEEHVDVAKNRQEMKLLESLLPERKYWSQDDIRGWVKDNKIDFTNKSSGQVIGMCMSKLRGHDVRGQDVREVIESMMAIWENLPKAGLAPINTPTNTPPVS